MFRRTDFALRPSIGVTPQDQSGMLATLAPDVVMHILQNLTLIETWNCGTLNRHLRQLVQQEVERRIQRFLQSTFGDNSSSFMEIVHSTGAAVMGSCLLRLFYSQFQRMECDLPPTIIVPSENFISLHLFLLALSDVVSFERTWLRQGYKSVCNVKWVYDLKVTLLSACFQLSNATVREKTYLLQCCAQSTRTHSLSLSLRKQLSK